MKKKILLLVALIAILILGAVNSGAWFTDQETSAGNKITAGTLNLTTNNTDGTTQSYQISNFKPGDWAQGGQVIVKNTGSVAGKLTITFVSVVDQENGCLEPEINDVPVAYKDTTCGELEGELSQYVRMAGVINAEPWGRRFGLTGDQTLSNLIGDTFEIGVLGPGESLPVMLEATWHPQYVTDHDNVVMSDGLVYDVMWKLEQVHNP